MTRQVEPLRLFALPQSPYCAKVRAVLRVKSIPFEEQEPAGGSYQTTEYQELVPAGSIPAIRHGDFVLHDSQAIVEYLEDICPQPPIWTGNRQLRARQRALVHYHDTKLEPVSRELIAHARQPEDQRNQLEVDLIRDRLFDRLYRLDRLVNPSPWLTGNESCLADWTYPTTLAITGLLLDAMEAELQLPDSLARWYAHAREAEPAKTEVKRAEDAIRHWLTLDEGRSQIH